MTNPVPFRSLRWLPLVAAACLLAACSTTSDVAATANPNVFTVSTRTVGVSTNWATAHENAVNEAMNFCSQRGMRASMKQESLSAGRGVSGRSELAFECHPTFEAMAGPRG
ncbi:hypothetical protein [Burkholderia ubonensis]|uniref:Lipoprotein n=1 Tax=Burkholderia ubonensis TaxID=101571 RepID=A0A119MK19_9BURK|nr:hypothetical protein [Burkholderia ubonensis]AOK61604.1 hypothetical protein WM29_20795 [Burkholderia ubonensis]KVS39062.1 hypothetical protein WK37_25805 [Burkholderia ubonensis]KVS46512.1 hypothetical protein WK38_00555 [Burkholderia ubonensis]KVS83928.1 hypothetical protein WK42_07200 [Burkholderia ubonensis]KVS92656.1 hypothetical protein WK44_11585 [Burkholderia ubonensis]